jgi:hypothetical protein
MKRWLVAVAILVGGAASFSYADYVLIRAVLGGNRQDPNNPNPVNPNNPGANPPGGRPRGPRGAPGRPNDPGGPDGRNPNDDPANIPTLGIGMTSDIESAAIAVQAVVAVKKKIPAPGMPNISSMVTHRWSTPTGATRLFNDNINIITRDLPIPTPHSRWEGRKAAAFKGDRSKIFELADWALAHGLYDEFAALMDGLVTSKEDQNAASPQIVKDAVKAYAQVKVALDKPIDSDVRANFWQSRLSARMEKSKHYAVIYTSTNANPPEVQSRLAALESHMRAFYYWFALRGLALPMPQDKLVAILLDKPDEFRKQRAVLEDEPLVSDGFYAHRDHICVFSAQRLDTPFHVFDRQVEPLWKNGTYERAKLLDGSEKKKNVTTPDDFRRMMTLALLERALEDEAERAAVTHEGTRQLLVATGLVPRTVIVPQWAEFGSAAVFETPKGPFSGAPIQSQTAVFQGVGGPSWAYLRYFKEHYRPEGTTTPVDLLKAVVSDTLFHKVQTNVDRQGNPVADREGLIRARSSAWALAYYLMKTRLPGMLRYYQELSGLPRDLEVDEKVLLASFARAFDVANATQDGVDPAKFEQLAKDWLSHMRGVPVPGVEFRLEVELNTIVPPPPGTPGATAPGEADAGRGRPGSPGRP